MKKVLIALISVLANSYSYADDIGHIRAEIIGIKHKPNSVLICFIFNSKNGFLQESKALQVLDAKVSPTGSVCEFDVPIDKEYAIAALQDENGNRLLDKNTFGAPKESWATSNNVTHVFSSPSFEESKVFLKEKSSTITLLMRN